MNHRLFFLFSLFPFTIAFADDDRAANLVILDENAVANLGIETVEAFETDFESTVFAVGRIEEIPSSHSALSSRIPGRVVDVSAFEGDVVKQGDILAKVESRQPGSPPPTVELRASQSGLVVKSHIRLGQPVEPENELLEISDRSQLWAVAKIPEQDAAELDVGAKAYLRVPALGSDKMEAELLRFGVTADREAGTIEGIFRLENVEGKLQPGMRVEFSIVTASRPDVMAVPRVAIQGSPIDRAVFVRDFELPNAFLRAPVQLGEQNEEFVEIIAGLFPGDEVVTTGAYSLAFAGSGTGLSLKEALDAAHGHEHNEDGSDMTDEQRASAASDDHDHHHHEHNSMFETVLLIYSGVTSLLIALFAPAWWRQRNVARPS